MCNSVVFQFARAEWAAVGDATVLIQVKAICQSCLSVNQRCAFKLFIKPVDLSRHGMLEHNHIRLCCSEWSTRTSSCARTSRVFHFATDGQKTQPV